MTQSNEAGVPKDGLLLTDFFKGDVTGTGLFEDRFGKLRAQFTISFKSRWTKTGQFQLDETTVFSDGEREERNWLFSINEAREIRGASAGVIGEITGTCSPCELRLHYRFILKMKSRQLKVKLHDRMYLQSDGSLINRATMSKWGVRLGELTVTLTRSRG